MDAPLAHWTPVALSLDSPRPSIDWGDLGAMRFAEPFFDQTIARWAGGDPPPRLVRTDVEALEALDHSPSLEPSGFIFHMSRCGSTLLARLLRQIAGCFVISEPSPLNTLLLAGEDDIDPERQLRLLRLLVRALGRHRFGHDRHLILKLSSWNVRKIDLFRRAFPATPIVWVQRHPAEVLASLLLEQPGWLKLQQFGDRAAALFGMPAEDIAAVDCAGFCAAALTSFLAALHGAVPAPILSVDYADLPDAAWHSVARFFGLTPSADEIAQMQNEAGFSAKTTEPVRFIGDSAERREIARRLGDLAGTPLMTLYRAHCRASARP